MEEKLLRHIRTIDSAFNLLRITTAFPPAELDWSCVASAIGGVMRLIKVADEEAREMLDMMTKPQKTKKAPEPAATETSAKENKDQADNTTEEPKPSKRTQITPELKMEVISRIKKGESVTKVAADLGIGTSTAFRIKSEAM